MFTASSMVAGSTVVSAFSAPFLFDQYFSSWLNANTGYSFTPLYTPQKASFPIFTYAQTGLQRNHTVQGSAGLTEATYQLTAWTTNYTDSLIMAGNLYSVLDGFSGTMSYGGGSVFVNGCFSTEESSEYTAPVNDSETGVHARHCVYHVWYNEGKSTPTLIRGG